MPYEMQEMGQHVWNPYDSSGNFVGYDGQQPADSTPATAPAASTIPRSLTQEDFNFVAGLNAPKGEGAGYANGRYVDWGKDAQMQYNAYLRGEGGYGGLAAGATDAQYRDIMGLDRVTPEQRQTYNYWAGRQGSDLAQSQDKQSQLGDKSVTGLGPIGDMALKAAASYFLGPVGGALVSGGMGLASGQKPLQAIGGAALGYGMGQLAGGMSGGVDQVGSDWSQGITDPGASNGSWDVPGAQDPSVLDSVLDYTPSLDSNPDGYNPPSYDTSPSTHPDESGVDSSGQPIEGGQPSEGWSGANPTDITQSALDKLKSGKLGDLSTSDILKLIQAGVGIAGIAGLTGGNSASGGSSFTKRAPYNPGAQTAPAEQRMAQAMMPLPAADPSIGAYDPTARGGLPLAWNTSQAKQSWLTPAPGPISSIAGGLNAK